MKVSHRITRLVLIALAVLALAAPAASARAGRPADGAACRPRRRRAPARRAEHRQRVRLGVGRDRRLPSPAGSSCSSAGAASPTATATSTSASRTSAAPARRPRGRHAPGGRAGEHHHRTHIWSSSVNHCPWVLTLPTRLETSTAERRLGHRHGRRRGRRRGGRRRPRRGAASRGARAAARSIRRVELRSHMCEQVLRASDRHATCTRIGPDEGRRAEIVGRPADRARLRLCLRPADRRSPRPWRPATSRARPSRFEQRGEVAPHRRAGAGTQTTTARPRFRTPRRACGPAPGRARSSALGGSAVYGQYGSYPGNATGTIWQVGAPTSGPPASATMRARSIAKLTARRTRMSSNGRRRTLRNIQSVPAAGSLCTLPGRAGNERLGGEPPRRSATNGSARTATSAAPRWTSAICRSIRRPSTAWTSIRSAKPAGRARRAGSEVRVADETPAAMRGPTRRPGTARSPAAAAPVGGARGCRRARRRRRAW